MPDRGDDGAGAVGGGRAAARPQIEPPSYGVAAPVGGSVKMTLGVSAVLSLRHFGLVFIPCRGGAAAPPAGRRRRFLFSECRIGATMAPARSAAGEQPPGRRLSRRATGSPRQSGAL